MPAGNESTRFKPGQSGNPGGTATGARKKLTGDFLHALANDFAENGERAIRACRIDRPDVYLKVIAALCPKEVEIKRPLQEMEDAELLAAVRALESFLATRAAQSGNGQATGGEPLN